MYQIVMSAIHDLAKDQHRDSDGVVSNIADIGTAMLAATQYMARLSTQYGGVWTIHLDHEEGSDPTRCPLRASMHLNVSEATIWVEVQLPEPKEDVEDIIRTLVANSRFVRNDTF